MEQTNGILSANSRAAKQPATDGIGAVRGALEELGFISFVAWLLLCPQIAFEFSSAAFAYLPLYALLFLAAFIVLCLLARSKKLVRVHWTMTGFSLLAACAGLAFAWSDSADVRSICMGAIVLCAAGLLVGWGSLLRSERLGRIVTLGLGAVAGAAALYAACFLFSRLIDPSFSQRAFALAYMALLSLLQLLPACYFVATRKNPADKQAFSALPKAEPLLTIWHGGGLLPWSAILFACSISASFLNGFTMSPQMFDWTWLNLTHSLAALAVSVGLLAFCRLLHVAAAKQVALIFRCSLFLNIVGIGALLFGQAGVPIARAVLACALDLMLVCALLFAFSESQGHRFSFMSRLMVSVLCTGLFWAQALGVMVQRSLGYEQFLILVAGTAVLMLLLFLVLVSNSFGARRPQAHDGAAGTDADADAAATASGAGTAQPALSSQQVMLAMREVNRAHLAAFKLSQRELQIAEMTLDGMTSAMIAKKLEIAERTVRFHMTNVYEKCGVCSKLEFLETIREQQIMAVESAADVGGDCNG